MPEFLRDGWRSLTRSPAFMNAYVRVSRKEGSAVYTDARSGRRFATLEALEAADGRSYDPGAEEDDFLDAALKARRRAKDHGAGVAEAESQDRTSQ